MQDAMLSALFGALSNEHRMNSISNNLANVNTTGYKRDLIGFRDTMALYAHDQILEPKAHLRSDPMFPEPQHVARPRIGVSYTDFSQSGLRTTGAPLDVAVSGDGFLKVQAPQGDMYTRNGHFRLTPEGTLITEQGFPVLDEGGGAITVPEGSRSITIAEDGRIYVDDNLTGQIGLFTLSDNRDLEKLGQNMFRLREGATATEVPTTAFLAQGFLESANVDPVYEMVNMIEAQRQFEAYAKVMQTSESIDREASTKVGRGR